MAPTTRKRKRKSSFLELEEQDPHLEVFGFVFGYRAIEPSLEKYNRFLPFAQESSEYQRLSNIYRQGVAVQETTEEIPSMLLEFTDKLKAALATKSRKLEQQVEEFTKDVQDDVPEVYEQADLLCTSSEVYILPGNGHNTCLN